MIMHKFNKFIISITTLIALLTMVGCDIDTNVGNNQDKKLSGDSVKEKIELISNAVLYYFPFTLDEPWEKEFIEDYINSINSNDFPIDISASITEILYDDMIVSERNKLIKDYLELALKSNFVDEIDAFNNLIDEYEKSKDERYLNLICEFLNYRINVSEYNIIRMKYYKLYFEVLWQNETTEKSKENEYLEYAKSLLEISVDYQERSSWAYAIAEKCPYNKVKIDILLFELSLITDDYNNGFLSQADRYRHLEIISEQFDENYIYYENDDDINTHMTFIYFAARYMDHEEIAKKYYNHLECLYGKDTFTDMNRHYD